MRIADRWFSRTTHSNGITQLTEPLVHRVVRCNIWHVRGRDRDLVIDTGLGVSSIVDELSDLLERPVLCVATHSHYDHVGGLHEFDQRLMHAIAAKLMNPYQEQMPLRWSDFGTDVIEAARTAGYEVDADEMLSALPHAGFDIDAFHTKSVSATRLIGEGDVVDLGDRHFDVLHLPGHTPCSIGLWEPETRTLFTGDSIYDGPLVDFLPESDIAEYVQTMRRLRKTPASVVHAGHDPSFGPDRLVAIIDSYLQQHS